ncbi:MAG: hypothetical protein E7642_06900 [Ruminococcaceae bacterium]|nr:hypothetical protein [Oscillospiraceae bacterium]
MYIIYKNNAFSISSELSERTVCELLAPVCIENDEEITVPFEKEENRVAVYKDEKNEVTLSVEQRSDTLFYISRTWKNTSAETRSIRIAQRVLPSFETSRYLIPCVSANGNEFGAGFEPKGLERDGKRWVFAYDRVSIPACTLTENADYACALFASSENALSLESSCSIYKDEKGRFVQELSHPIAELPITYSSRDKYAEGYETFLTLAPDETISVGAYLSVCKPRWENYGICDVLDTALELYGDNGNIACPTNRELWDRSIVFAKSLISEYKGKKGLIIGFLPDGNGGFSYRGDNCFELAWCGQNVLFSRMLIEDYIRFGHEDSLKDALEILDTRVKFCTAKSGLLAAQMRDFEDLDAAAADTCNMGYGAYEFIRTYLTLKKINIDRPAYLDAARGLCDFFVEHFSDKYGFGKKWRLSGECLDEGGTIGGFVIPALVKMYDVTAEKKYLDIAERAMHFYMERDLDKFVSTAGALDTCCVDKETSFPFIVSGILLYESTKNEKYLECAKKSAYYFTSWMFHYDPIYDASSEITEYNVTVKGLTSVSAQHHHLDMYAGIVVPYLRRLAELTGDENWRVRADMMWRAVTQYIGDGELKIHNVVRPVGSQNEALFHCRWGFGSGKRGQLNDWLVAWPCAFRLSVLAEEEF